MKHYRIAAWFLLPVFFWYFHKGVLKAHLGPDEPMNLYTYWQPPLWKTLGANIVFWSHFLRPAAAAYYLPLYRLFGLNSTPYNVVRYVLLLGNTALFYQLAFRLSRSRWVALLAALPMAYHAELGYLAWSGAFIYDILCGTFFFGALLYYVVRRKAAESLSIGQTCVFLALYILALDAKEMAVSLPVVVLAYELLFHKPGRDLRTWGKRLAPALLAGALTLLFVLGKTGQGSLTDTEAYRPVFTWSRFSESSIRYLNHFTYSDNFTMPAVIAVWALLLLAGLIRFRDPRWLFLWVWIMVTPLPIAFLPDRGGAQLYLVLGGWSLAGALVCRILMRMAAWVLTAVRLPLRDYMVGGLVLCGGGYAHATWTSDQPRHAMFKSNGEDTLVAIHELEALHLQPRPGSQILFLNNPFPADYDTEFLASLLWNDHSLKIDLQNRAHLPSTEVDQKDYLLDYKDGSFLIVKSPR